MDIVTGNLGWIEAICGPMFSGKSEELMRRLRRSMIARKRVQVFKPLIDDRYSNDEIVSHNDLRMKSQAVQSAADIRTSSAQAWWRWQHILPTAENR
jgi:thymidine kinase